MKDCTTCDHKVLCDKDELKEHREHCIKNNYFCHFVRTDEATMNKILETLFKKGICPKCGEVQSHSKRWCHCGGEFYINRTFTLFDALKYAHNREIQSIRLSSLRPDYLAAIYKRKLEEKGIQNAEQKFTQYIKDKLHSS